MELAAGAARHAITRHGFFRPVVLAVHADLHVPGAAAVWLEDRSGRDCRPVGVVLHWKYGVMAEFDPAKHERLPPNGIEGLLVDADVHP
jgi:hypothetical protein